MIARSIFEEVVQMTRPSGCKERFTDEEERAEYIIFEEIKKDWTETES